MNGDEIEQDTRGGQHFRQVSYEQDVLSGQPATLWSVPSSKGSIGSIFMSIHKFNDTHIHIYTQTHQHQSVFIAFVQNAGTSPGLEEAVEVIVIIGPAHRL